MGQCVQESAAPKASSTRIFSLQNVGFTRKAVTTQRFLLEERTHTNFFSLQLTVATAKSRFAAAGKRDSGPGSRSPAGTSLPEAAGGRSSPARSPRRSPARHLHIPPAARWQSPGMPAPSRPRPRPRGAARPIPSAPSPAVGALSGAAASPEPGPPPPRPGRSPHLPATPPPPAGRGNMKRSRRRAARRGAARLQRRRGHRRAPSGGGRAGALPGRRRAGREPWGAAAPEGARAPGPASRLPPWLPRRRWGAGGAAAAAGKERCEPRRCPPRSAASCGTCSQPCCCTVSAGRRGYPWKRLGCEGAPKTSLAGVEGRGGCAPRRGRGRWVPAGRDRSGRGWEAGSPRWLCLSPVLAARGWTTPKAPRSRVCVTGGLCCSLGLLGCSCWSGHLTQSFFTHLRARAGAAELRRV